MLREFNVERTAQAAALLLQPEDGCRMRCERLLKLLYIADRKSMRQTGFPITGDDPYAMSSGPLLLITDRLLYGGHEPDADPTVAAWRRWIRTAADCYAELVVDPGFRKLTRRDVSILQAVRPATPAVSRGQPLRSSRMSFRSGR